MDKNLKPDEVEAFLAGLALDVAAPEEEREDKGMGFEIPRLPRFEVINDRFARLATNGLSNLFGVRVELNPISIDAAKFGEFMRCQPVPSGFAVCESNVFGTEFLIVLDSRLVFTMTEIAFGGAGHHPRIEGREFTRVEQGVIDKAENVVLSSLEEAWRTCVADTRMSRARPEINPQFVGIVKSDTPCLVTYFEVEFDMSLASLTVVMPYPALEPYEDMLRSHNQNLRVFADGGTPEPSPVPRATPKLFDPHRKFLAFLDDIPATSLAMFLRNEHPQTIACVAAHMSPTSAANLVMTLPAGLRAEIVARMDRLDIRNQAFLGTLENVLLCGIFSIPAIFMDTRKGRAVMEALRHMSPETYAEIREEILEESESFFD